MGPLAGNWRMIFSCAVSGSSRCSAASRMVIVKYRQLGLLGDVGEFGMRASLLAKSNMGLIPTQFSCSYTAKCVKYHIVVGVGLAGSGKAEQDLGGAVDPVVVGWVEGPAFGGPLVGDASCFGRSGGGRRHGRLRGFRCRRGGGCFRLRGRRWCRGGPGGRSA